MNHSGSYLENKNRFFAHLEQDGNIFLFDDMSLWKAHAFELVLNYLSMVMTQHHTNRIFNSNLLHYSSCFKYKKPGLVGFL